MSNHKQWTYFNGRIVIDNNLQSFDINIYLNENVDSCLFSYRRSYMRGSEYLELRTFYQWRFLHINISKLKLLTYVFRNYYRAGMLRGMISNKQGKYEYCYRCGNIANHVADKELLGIKYLVPICNKHDLMETAEKSEKVRVETEKKLWYDRYEANS